MANLATLFHESIRSIEKEKSNGISFQWNKLDLSDLLLAEWIAFQIKPTSKAPLQGLELIKFQIHAWLTRRKYITKPPLNDAEVLVYFNSQNQWNNLEPIVKALHQQGTKLIVLSTKPNLLKVIQHLNIPSKLIYGVKPSAIPCQSSLGLQHIIKVFLPKLNYLYKAVLPLLSPASMRYVLIGNDNTSEGRMIATLAQQHNHITGSIQHGSMNRINPIHGRSAVDQFFVYGEKPKQELVYLGKKADQIFVKGWPLQEKFKQSQQQTSTTWKGFTKPTIVITFSGPGHGTTEAHHLLCIEAVKQVQDELQCQLLIKLHPKDKANYYEKLNPAYTTLWNNQDVEKHGITFHELIKKAQLVITGASNSALDALLMETEVITLDLLKAYTEVDFVQDNLVTYCTSIVDLKQAVAANLQNQKSVFTQQQKEQLETYYYRFFDKDYSPIQAVVETIQESIKQ